MPHRWPPGVAFPMRRVSHTRRSRATSQAAHAPRAHTRPRYTLCRAWPYPRLIVTMTRASQTSSASSQLHTAAATARRIAARREHPSCQSRSLRPSHCPRRSTRPVLPASAATRHPQTGSVDTVHRCRTQRSRADHRRPRDSGRRAGRLGHRSPARSPGHRGHRGRRRLCGTALVGQPRRDCPPDHRASPGRPRGHQCSLMTIAACERTRPTDETAYSSFVAVASCEDLATRMDTIQPADRTRPRFRTDNPHARPYPPDSRHQRAGQHRR